MIVIQPLDIAVLFVGFISYNCYICNHPEKNHFPVSHHHCLLILIDALYTTCIGLIGATFLMFVWHEILDGNRRLFCVRQVTGSRFTERIWDMILEIVRQIAECFNIEDEQILDMLVNRSDKLRHFVEIYQLKLAS